MLAAGESVPFPSSYAAFNKSLKARCLDAGVAKEGIRTHSLRRGHHRSRSRRCSRGYHSGSWALVLTGVHLLHGLCPANEAYRDASAVATRALGVTALFGMLRESDLNLCVSAVTLWMINFGAADVDLIGDLVPDPSEQSEKCYLAN